MLPHPFSNVCVAVVGSRHGSLFNVAQLCHCLTASGCSVVTGCANGVDKTVRLTLPSARVISAMSFVRRGLPVSAALAARTRAVVLASNAVCIFPPRSGSLGAGSLLALQTALESNRPVWVAGATPPTPSGWQPFTLAGVFGWLFHLGSNSLF
jgi:hypothetical protein